MRNKKSFVFGETNDLIKTFERVDFKSDRVSRQWLAKSEVKYVA